MVCIHHCLKDYRGQQKDIRYISTSQVIMTFKLPLSEMIVDFFDKLKTVSSGYAKLVLHIV